MALEGAVPALGGNRQENDAPVEERRLEGRGRALEGSHAESLSGTRASTDGPQNKEGSGRRRAREGGGAHLSGISRGLRAQGREDVIAVGFFGDGGTYDIGFQGLSAAAERNENILVITKDNEAYMNTGNQRSGSTPKYATTSTNYVGPKSRGKAVHKKKVPQIFAAHGVPYVATASVAYPEDLIAKVNYAKGIQGFRMIIIQSPCPVGWRYSANKTIEVARNGVQSGVWPLYEILDGEDFKLNYRPRELKPVSEYLKAQARFRHMTEDEIMDVQIYTTARWEQLIQADDLKKLIM